MSWNHRLMAHSYKHGDTEDVYFAIHEVYYEKDGITPTACTKEPAKLTGDSVDGFKWTLDKMQECLKKPIIWYDDDKFPQEYKS